MHADCSSALSEEKQKCVIDTFRQEKKDRHEQNTPVYKECFHYSNEGRVALLCQLRTPLVFRAKHEGGGKKQFDVET
jgi:hypothetical protein